MATICNVYVHVDLWMVGFCWVPHSNHDTQSNTEFYHGVLKHKFFFESKGLRGCHIDWLVWRLTTIVVRHMHQVEMKRQGFIKNKVMAQFMVASVEKAFMIPHINVIYPTPMLVHESCKTNTILVSFTIFMPLSSNMHFAHASGHCATICESTKLLFSWHVPTLLQTISLSVVTHGMGPTAMGLRQCLQT